MYKLSIVNEVNGATYGYKNDSKQEKDDYLDQQIAKQGWGKNEREILEEEISVELRSRIISTRIVKEVITAATSEILDEDGKILIEAQESFISIPEQTIHLVKADYVVTETDLSKDKDFRNSVKVEARKKEYKSIEQVVHLILDKGIDSQEFADYLTERAAIKVKYPKE